MSLRLCPHESEVKALVQAGHWPQAAPDELRMHAAGCRACADLVLLTQAFQADRAVASSAAQLPAPGVLWWRAQLRRRNAAIERVSRPILGAQIFAIAIAVAAVAAILLVERRESLRWLSEIGNSRTFDLSGLLASPASTQWLGITWNLSYLIPVLAAAVLLGGLVVYLASEKQ
jgi:hypothetical protein